MQEHASLTGIEGELWSDWCCNHDPRTRDKLIHHFLPYARMLAAKLYGRRIGNEFEFDDYLQYATIGLIEAIDRYSPDRGAKFTTYATARVEGAILSGLERLSEQQQQLGLIRRLKQDRLRHVDEEKLAKSSADDLLCQLAEVGIGLALGFVLEGDGMLLTDESASTDIGYERLEVKQLRARLLDSLLQLTVREQEVMRMHYLHEITFEEISRLLGISKGRVSQLHKQALARLRTFLGKAGLCDVRY